MRELAADISRRLSAVRDRTLAILDPLDDEWLTRTPDPIMSPPAWDMAHIAAYEDLWLVTRLAGADPMPRPGGHIRRVRDAAGGAG